MPERVIETLRLRESDVVADIDAGTGYFSRRFARQVAHVYAEEFSRSSAEDGRFVTGTSCPSLVPELRPDPQHEGYRNKNQQPINRGL